MARDRLRVQRLMASGLGKIRSQLTFANNKADTLVGYARDGQADSKDVEWTLQLVKRLHEQLNKLLTTKYNYGKDVAK